VAFVNLQVGPRATEAGLPDLSPLLTDFAATAALVATLDLVISVDTAVAHLAGAMGVPLWVLLSDVPDWRWHMDRDDSDWYASARLYRQSAPGDWDGVIRRVVAALDQKRSSP
jgi:ADP-heptose:LPS heptosyltransferase